jgi:hypothetical protein
LIIAAAERYGRRWPSENRFETKAIAGNEIYDNAGIGI